MDISTLYKLFRTHSCVTTDSRNCPEGSIFFALKGDVFNGNAFAANALDKGCSYAIVDEQSYLVQNDNRYILVGDVLNTLQELANYHRRQLGTKMIAITGTNGKTTTKELIASVLSQKFNVLYTQGNLNNHIGVPLTLLQLNKDHDWAVIEMGASYPGEIKLLTEIAEPDYGLITNVGKAHLEGFGSFEGVIKTKGELYDYLRNKKNSKVFIHYDNPYLMNISHGLDLVPYGAEESLYINGKVESNSPYLSITWKAGEKGEQHLVHTQLIGAYNFTNVLAAVTIGHFLQVNASDIDEALASYSPRNNRSQLKETEHNTLIIDAYNANPTSMMAALENFRIMDAEHKTVILGDMRELGTDSAMEHQRIIDYLDEAHFEHVALVGEQFAASKHKYDSYKNVGELIEFIKESKPEHKTILIKGSNSIKLQQLAMYL